MGKAKPWYRTPVPVGPCPTCGCYNMGSPTTNLCFHCFRYLPCPQLSLPKVPPPQPKCPGCGDPTKDGLRCRNCAS